METLRHLRLLLVGAGRLAVFLFCVTAHALPGRLDPAFGVDGRLDWSLGVGDSYGRALAIGPLNQTYAVSLCVVEDNLRLCVERWSEPGARDASFADNGVLTVSSVTLSSSVAHPIEAHATNAGLLIVATCRNDVAQMYPCVTRMRYDGTLDPAFGIDGTTAYDASLNQQSTAQGARLTAAGDIVVATQCTARPCARKWSSSGQLDPSFQPPAIPGAVSNGAVAQVSTTHYLQSSWCHAVAPAPAAFELCLVRRELASGASDESYGSSGILRLNVFSTVAAPTVARPLFGGGALLAASSWQSTVYVVRLDPTGVPDTSYGASGVAQVTTSTPNVFVHDVQVDSVGRTHVLAACSVINPPSAVWSKWCVLRWDASGEVDESFVRDAFLSQPVNTTTGASQSAGAMQIDGEGRVLVFGGCVPGETTSKWNVCLARLKGGPYDAMSCSLNGDANALVETGTDGILVARYLFGFRGVALTENAVGPNSGRTNAAIETHLATSLAQGKLDADGDGQSLATTDGLLILRAMLGLTGDALTAGAVNTSHPNVRTAQQILTWIETTHGVACLP